MSRLAEYQKHYELYLQEGVTEEQKQESKLQMQAVLEEMSYREKIELVTWCIERKCKKQTQDEVIPWEKSFVGKQRR